MTTTIDLTPAARAALTAYLTTATPALAAYKAVLPAARAAYDTTYADTCRATGRYPFEAGRDASNQIVTPAWDAYTAVERPAYASLVRQYPCLAQADHSPDLLADIVAMLPAAPAAVDAVADRAGRAEFWTNFQTRMLSAGVLVTSGA
jgi:hypothetical protein